MNPLVTKWESLRLVAYDDGGGVATIGYGHIKTLTKADIGRKRITKLEALRLLEEDIKPLETYVMKRFPGLIKSTNRFNAVVSFIFNCGIGALDGKSTKIGKWIKAGKWPEAAVGMLHWIKDNGRVVNGLVNRRVEEAANLIKG